MMPASCCEGCSNLSLSQKGPAPTLSQMVQALTCDNFLVDEKFEGRTLKCRLRSAFETLRPTLIKHEASPDEAAHQVDVPGPVHAGTALPADGATNTGRLNSPGEYRVCHVDRPACHQHGSRRWPVSEIVTKRSIVPYN